MYSINAVTHKNVGSVLLYAKNYMKVVKMNKINVNAYDTPYVEITEKNKKYILDVVYRPPKLRQENDIIL